MIGQTISHYKIVAKLGEGGMGVSWSPDGERIVFSSTGGRLWEIPARGGEPRVLLDREQDSSPLRAPHFLPTDSGSEGLVYTVGVNADSRIWVMDLETGERRELVSGLDPIYSPDGYLIYQAAGLDETGLRALPFSLASLEPTGEAFPFPISVGGVGASVSQDGALAYLDDVLEVVLTELSSGATVPASCLRPSASRSWPW